MDSIEYEALRRAQEMQRGGNNQNRNQGNNSSSHQNNQNHNSNRRQSPAPTQNESSKKSENISNHADAQKPQPATPPSNLSNDMLGSLFEDKEKLLILALILILSGEESHDPALILALLYLII